MRIFFGSFGFAHFRFTADFRGNNSVARISYLLVETAPALSPDERSSDVSLLQSGYRYALSLTHHAHDAEDLVQESWLNLCRRYGSVPSRAALFTAIRHLFIDHCRRAHVIAFDSIDQADVSGLSTCAASGNAEDLEHLLGRLRPAERETVYLHYVEGHTAEEIGALTSQPRGTVLSLLHRALKKLRASISD